MKTTTSKNAHFAKMTGLFALLGIMNALPAIADQAVAPKSDNHKVDDQALDLAEQIFDDITAEAVLYAERLTLNRISFGTREAGIAISNESKKISGLIGGDAECVKKILNYCDLETCANTEVSKTAVVLFANLLSIRDFALSSRESKWDAISEALSDLKTSKLEALQGMAEAVKSCVRS